MKTKNTQKMINIKREISVDEYLRSFIFSNINYRRFTWNAFVEESRRCSDPNDFDPAKYWSKFVRMSNRRSDPYYCEYIEQEVVQKMRIAINRCKRDNFIDRIPPKKTWDSDAEENLDLYKKYHQPRYKSYDRYRGSFTIHARPQYYEAKQPEPHKLLSTKTKIVSKSKIHFRAHKNNLFDINLKEDLYNEKMDIDGETWFVLDTHRNDKTRCYFREEDIKTVSFIHDIGKFYIQLSIEAFYVNIVKDIRMRQSLAGIDLGIHNPVVIFDGTRYINISMSDKEKNRIHFLERRVRRLQRHMRRKQEINIKNGIRVSKSYERLRLKYRKTWKRIFNIRLNWRRHVCRYIALCYQTIVVDPMITPNKKTQEKLPRKVLTRMNSISRFYGMSYFQEYLIHACEKFGTTFIKAKANTTRTCSRCGEKNPHLKLSERIFRCNYCGYEVDRDYNAAQNCYYQEEKFVLE